MKQPLAVKEKVTPPSNTPAPELRYEFTRARPNVDVHRTPVKNRRAVVIIWQLTHLKELARLVRFLQRDTHWQPVVLLGYSVSATPEAKREWNAAGVPWFVFGSLPVNARGGFRRFLSVAYRICAFLLHLALLWPLVFTKRRLGVPAYQGLCRLGQEARRRSVMFLRNSVAEPAYRRLARLRQMLQSRPGAAAHRGGAAIKWLGIGHCFRWLPWSIKASARDAWRRLPWSIMATARNNWRQRQAKRPHARLGWRPRINLGWRPRIGLGRWLRKMLRLPANIVRMIPLAPARLAIITSLTSIGRGIRSIYQKVARRTGLSWLLEQKAQFRLHVEQMNDTLRIARDTFAQLKPDVIVLAEDNVSYPTGLFIKAARQRGAASVVIPYTLASTKEFVEGFRDDPDCSTRHFHNWLVARLLPKWSCSDQDREFLRLPGHQALAMEWLGIAPDKPWVPNDGHWNAFAVESRRMRQRYLEDFGMPAERLALTGAMSDDSLYAAKRQAARLKKEVYRELGLRPGRPLVLIALPPNQLSRKHPDQEFTDYRHLTRFIVESLQSLTLFHVVFSLHPRIDPETSYYIKSLGANICLRDTLEMVPICDVYIASVSATIRWAIACGLPVINYDIFHYHYDDYDGAPGVINVRTKKEWLTLLDDMDRHPDWITNFLALRPSAADDWGQTDGQSGRRLVELFDKLAPQAA